MFHCLFSIVDWLGSVPVLLHTLHDGKVTSVVVWFASPVSQHILGLYVSEGEGRKKIPIQENYFKARKLHCYQKVHLSPFTWETEQGLTEKGSVGPFSQKGFHKVVLISKDNPRQACMKIRMSSLQVQNRTLQQFQE